MKENLVNLSFLAAGHVVQDIVLAEGSEYTAEQIVDMLCTDKAFTSIHEDNDLILADGTVIGTVRYSDTELEISDFQVEGGEYVLDKATPEIFNATHLAWAAAYGEFIDAPEMSITQMLYSLEASGTELPSMQVAEAYENIPANILKSEIASYARGISSLMELAYDAGKAGQEKI